MNKQYIWDKRFMHIAREVASWSSCTRRGVGAVIVKDKRILTTGYNGAPAGVTSCRENNSCLRINSTSGQDLYNCLAIHAEENAILQAAKLGTPTNGAMLYCTTKPCDYCIKSIINAGIIRIVYEREYPTELTDRLAAITNIEMIRFTE